MKRYALRIWMTLSAGIAALGLLWLVPDHLLFRWQHILVSKARIQRLWPGDFFVEVEDLVLFIPAVAGAVAAWIWSRRLDARAQLLLAVATVPAVAHGARRHPCFGTEVLCPTENPTWPLHALLSFAAALALLMLIRLVRRWRDRTSPTISAST